MAATTTGRRGTAHMESKGVKVGGELTQEELFKQAFYYLNSFKRHRALEQIKQHEGDRQAVQFNQLKQYQFIDSLELALRALQSGHRNMTEAAEAAETEE